MCNAKKCLLIAYSPEISLKGKNRPEFELRVEQSILNVLKNMNLKEGEFILTKEFSRFILILPNSFECWNKIITELRRISGVLFIALSYMTELDINCIKNISTVLFLSKLNKEIGSFKVDTKRSNKSYELTSPQINIEVASLIFDELEKKGITLNVDLKHPHRVLSIEILNHAFILSKKYGGVAGLPCGVEGKMIIDARGLSNKKEIDNLLLCSFLVIRRGVMPIILINDFNCQEEIPEHIKKVLSIVSTMAGSNMSLITSTQYENNKEYSEMLIAECYENPQDLNLFNEKPWRFVFPLITDDNFKDKMNKLMGELFDEFQ